MKMQQRHSAPWPCVLRRTAVAVMIAGGLALSGCETTPESGAGATAKAAPPAPPKAARTDAQCREFQRTITIGGKTEKAYGTACRQPDGTWKEVDKGSATPPPPRQAQAEPDNSFPYQGYPRRYLGPGAGPFYFGLGIGSHGGGVGYGVGF